MRAFSFVRRFHQPFKVIWTAFLLCALLLSGFPLITAKASGINDLPKAPLPTPGASLSLSINPMERVMINEDFDFYAAFDNPSTTPGYGPFIDLILPTNGADGAAGTDTPDGISIVSASYDGYTLPKTSIVFPDADGAGPGTTGCVAHPLALDATGSAVQVCGTTGDTLVVLELPFSSITQSMPMLYAEVVAHVSELADVDTPLTILGRGGYRYGADNLDNPASDPAILDPSSTDGTGWPSLTVTPHVIAIEKTFDGPKECPYLTPPTKTVIDKSDCPYGDVTPVYENVSGPNFQRHYDINVYVATGQTVTNLDVTDYFPNNIAFLSVDSLGGGTLVDSPTVGAAANTPNNDLIVHFALLSGSTDIVVAFFIPELDADGNPVLDPTTGASAIADNIATALGDWDPVDPRDAATPGNAIANGPCPGTCVPLHELNIRSLAVQKSVEIADDTGAPGYSPGDVLKYTLDFQISDYFTFGDIVLTDVLSDGQRFDNPGGDFPPTFSVSDRNTTITDQDFIYTPPPASSTPADDLTIDETQIGNSGPGITADGTDGSTTLTFDISKAMLNAGATDGILQGGEAGATAASSATGSVTYYAVIQEDFSDTYPSGDSSVDHGDVLFNAAKIEATIRDENTITTTLNTQTNDSAQKIEIVYDGLNKSIYAINGSTTFTPVVQPEDTITFRLRQSLPSSDSDYLALTDFLPLPILDAAEITTFDDVTDATLPAAGHAKFGPSSTLNAALASPALPTISADTANNSLKFDFGSFDDPTDTTTEIDVLFTLTVSNNPYADGAVLTNLSLGEENTTNNEQLLHTGTVRFTLKEPGITISKGVVASDNAGAVFVPNPPGPVPFNAPGSNPSWSGLIASGDNDPSTSLINSGVQNVKAGDLLTFAIILENLGHSTLGAFDISLKDALPTNLVIPSGGINLQVRRGDGAVITHSPVGSTTTDPSGLFDSGMSFTDESPTQGAAHVYDAANGQNIIVITYDLQISPSAPAGSTITNTAVSLSYAGTEGGPNHIGAVTTNNLDTDDATALLVAGKNVAPVITEGSSTNVTMSEDGSPIPFALTLHATDGDGDPLTWSVSSTPTFGAANVAVGPANSTVVSYTPYPNYNGTDSFVVQVSDGSLTDTITVNVTIQAVNDQSNLIFNQSYNITYDGWRGVRNLKAFGQGYRKAVSGKFTFSPSTTFTQANWITYRGPDQGMAQIFVDGKPKLTVDLYKSTPQWRYSIAITGLSKAHHVIQIKALKQKRPASSGTWVVVDAFQLGSGIPAATTFFDDIGVYNNVFSYGDWAGEIASGDSRYGAFRISTTPNATLSFAFDGTQFTWIAARGPSYGKAAIYVDNKLVKTADFYKSMQQWQYSVLVKGLAYGHHTITIKVLNTKNSASSGHGVVCDGFLID